MWTWNDDYTADAAFTCEKGDDTRIVQAVVVSDVIDGKMIYTATAAFDGKAYTDTRIGFSILTHPQDAVIYQSQNVTFTVNAPGAKSFQWYYRKSNASDWIRVMNNGNAASYTTSGSEKRNNWMFRCEVTSDEGTLLSKEAKIVYADLFRTQPQDNRVIANQIAVFTVDAAAENAVYQWYYSKNSGKTWIRVVNNGTSATYRIAGSPERDGWLFRCKATTDQASVYSRAALLECDSMIVQQPEDVTAVAKKNVSFTVDCNDDNAAYQWYYSKNAGATWIRVANHGTSATYTTMASADRNGWLFRCKVTNSNKLEEISRAAKLEFDSLITKQPVDVTIRETKNVSFTVETKGNVTYQWYYRKGSSGSWIIVKNNGTSATYLTQGSKARNGWQFCCVVSDGTNRVTSDIAQILFQA